MKNIAAIAVIVATTFFAAGSAPAQDHLVKATVPFTFTAGDRTLPSGTYTIGSRMSAVPSATLLTMKKLPSRRCTIAGSDVLARRSHVLSIARAFSFRSFAQRNISVMPIVSPY